MNGKIQASDTEPTGILKDAAVKFTCFNLLFIHLFSASVTSSRASTGHCIGKSDYVLYNQYSNYCCSE